MKETVLQMQARSMPQELGRALVVQLRYNVVSQEFSFIIAFQKAGEILVSQLTAHEGRSVRSI